MGRRAVATTDVEAVDRACARALVRRRGRGAARIGVEVKAHRHLGDFVQMSLGWIGAKLEA